MDRVNIAWQLIGQIAAGLGVLVALIQAYKYLRSQTSIAKLESKVQQQSEHLEKDYKHLESIDIRLNTFEKRLIDYEETQAKEVERLNSSLDRLGKSLAAILNYMVEGNGVDKMREERDKLIEFFINSEKK